MQNGQTITPPARAVRRALALVATSMGVAAFLVGTMVAAGSSTAGAQLPPAPTLPPPEPPPAEFEPMADATGPAAHEVCARTGVVPGTITSAASLASLAMAIVGGPQVQIPAEVYEYSTAGQQPCAYTPVPDQVSSCAADREVDAIVDTVYSETGAGFATVFLPVSLPKTGPWVDLAVAVEAMFAEYDVPVTGNAAQQSYDSLGCVDTLGGLGGGLEPSPGGTPAPPARTASVGESANPGSGPETATPRPTAAPPSLTAAGPASSELAAPAGAGAPVGAQARDLWPWWRAPALALCGLGAVALTLRRPID